MDSFERRLALSGLLMFLFGLVFGFVVHRLPNPHQALAAHLNAVQSGTFLIALGLLWPKLAVWTRAATPLVHLTWISFWLLEAGQVAGAFAPAGAPPEGVKLAAAGLNALGAIGMTVAIAALVFTFRPAAARTEAAKAAA